MMDRRTKQLFEWAAANAEPAPLDPAAQSKRLDPSMLESILGPNDSTLMLAAMNAIQNPTLPLDDRYLLHPRRTVSLTTLV